MSLTVETLRVLEGRRLRALVEADATVLEAVHAAEFVLVNPSGGVWSKARYIGGVLTGEINYRKFAAVSGIEVVAEGNLAVLRYRSAIDIHVAGQQAGPLECWHMDCYRRATADEPWQVIWSQATACD
jgi:hypothetical protein